MCILAFGNCSGSVGNRHQALKQVVGFVARHQSLARNLALEALADRLRHRHAAAASEFARQLLDFHVLDRQCHSIFYLFV